MSIYSEVIAFVALEKVLGFKPKAIRSITNGFETRAVDVLENLKSSQVSRSEYDTTLSVIEKCIDESEEAIAQVSKIAKFVLKGSEFYPRQLSLIKNAPYLLYVRGDITALSLSGVSVVGSRKASQEGQMRAMRAAKLLGGANYSVNSGLALGIDTAAHIGALQFGYHTTAVIGTPVLQFYPKENKQLQETIARKGTLVSQFSPLSTVQPLNFPLRNEVMSGLSLATVIVEAGETSGALTQAKFALSQGRRLYIMKNQLEKAELKWPRKFIELGAKSLEAIDDLVEDLSSLVLEEEKAVKSAKQLSLL